MERNRGRIRKAIAAAVIVLMGTSTASVGQELKKIADRDDLDDRVRIVKTSKPNEKGEGPGANLAKLAAPPKRVGLVSFYVHDKGSGTGTYYSSRRTFSSLTQDGASHFADRYHEQGLAALREAFAAQGMEVLTPDQFLDSDEKKRAFRSYKLEQSRVMRMLLGAMGKMEDAANSGAKLNQSAVAPGYRLLPVHPGPADPSTGESLNELRMSMGLDAVLIIRNGSFSNDKALSLREIELMLYGPNPVQKVEGTRYIGYLDGQIYVDAFLDLKDGAEVAQFKKEAITSESYEGYEKLMAAVAKRAAAYLVDEIGKK